MVAVQKNQSTSREPPLSQELDVDLVADRILVGLGRQQEVGPVLLKLLKTGAGYEVRPPGSARPRDPVRRVAAVAPLAHGFGRLHNRPG
jgi:hypothetical protein